MNGTLHSVRKVKITHKDGYSIIRIYHDRWVTVDIAGEERYISGEDDCEITLHHLDKGDGIEVEEVVISERD